MNRSSDLQNRIAAHKSLYQLEVVEFKNYFFPEIKLLDPCLIQRNVQKILFRTRSRRTKNNFSKMNCGLRFETRLSKSIRRSACARQLFCLRFNNVYLLNSRRQLLLTSELCSPLNEHAILSAATGYIPHIPDGRPDSSVLARGPMPSAASTDPQAEYARLADGYQGRKPASGPGRTAGRIRCDPQEGYTAPACR